MGNFDATKLEVVSITKIANSDYGFAAITPNINNTSGTFTVSFISNNSNPNEATSYTGNFAEVTFKGKATGTASLNFTCSKDFVDSNIIASDTINTDLIDCATNQSGSYTITAGVGGDSTSTTATATPTSSTLPQTGATAPTVIMV